MLEPLCANLFLWNRLRRQIVEYKYNAHSKCDGKTVHLLEFIYGVSTCTKDKGELRIQTQL